MIGATPNVLVVNSRAAGAEPGEFVAYLRKQPGAVSYGSAGQGSLTHLTMELFKQQVNSFMVHIPYRGIAPAFTDLLGGQTQADVPWPGRRAAAHPVGPRAAAGRDRATSAIRCSRTCRRWTSRLQGLRRPAVVWRGGPPGCPHRVKLLNESLNTVLSSPDLRDKLSAEAVEPLPMTPEQFGRFIRADIARWTRGRARKIQPNWTPEPMARNTRVAADHRRPADHAHRCANFVATPPVAWLERRRRPRSAPHLHQLDGLRGRRGAHESVHAALAAVQMLQPAPQAQVPAGASAWTWPARRCWQRHRVAHLRLRRHAPEDHHPPGRSGGVGAAAAGRAHRRLRAAR
jgi:hypothetical protein